MNVSFKSKLAAGFLLMLAVLVYFGWNLYDITRRADEDNRLINHTHEVLNTLEAVLAAMIDVETGARGFVITRQENFLEPFRAGSDRVDGLVGELRSLTSDNPRQRAYIDTLQSLLGVKLRITEMILRAGHANGTDSGAVIIRQGAGKLAMDRIRTQIDTMRAEEHRLLAARRDRAAESGSAEVFMVLTSLSILFVFAGLLFWSVRRYPTLLEKTRAELEHQVKRQTAEIVILNRLYATLSQVNQMIVRTRSRDELFSTICRVAVEHGGFQLAWVGVWDAAREEVVPAAVKSPTNGEFPFQRIHPDRMPFRNGLIGRAISSGDIVSCRDIMSDPAMEHWRTAAAEKGFRSAVAVPFRMKGKIAGLLNLYAAEPGFFDVPEEQKLLEEMSLDVSFALDSMEIEAERNRAIERLQRNEALLTETGKLSRVGGWELHVPTKTVAWTEETYRIHELSRSTKPSLDEAINFYAPEARPVITEAVEKCIREGTPWDLELPFITATGRRIWVRAIGQSEFRDGQCLRLFGVFQDITERRLAEQTLRHNERQLRQIIDLVPHFIYARDATGRYILVNKAMAEAFGTTVAKLTGRPHADIARSAEEAGRVRSEDQAVIDSGEPVEIPEETITDAAGEERILSTVKTPFTIPDSESPGVLVVSVDITDRKRTGEERRKSEEQFRLISENVADMIAVLDLEGKRLYTNPSYKPILGDPTSIVGSDSFREIHPEDRERIRHIFRETVRTGVGQRAEYRFVGKDGAVHYIESQGSVIRDQEGNVATVVVVSRNVTEKKQIEKQFLRMQRMESIGTLAGGIAHDLNNVLSPILLSIDIIARKLHDEQSRKMLDMLHSTAKRGADLIRQVLSFARGVEGERSIVQIRHLLEEVGKVIGETFPRAISIVIDVPKSIPTVAADPTQLHQVLMNLCVNARDAMPKGGKLELKAEYAVLDEQYTRMHVGTRPGNYVVLTVTDQGMGIPPGAMERIFEPFFTTKEVGKGTGIGLSTVLAIVKSHDGFVNVYSELGKGSTFKVYLPAQEAAPATASEEAAKPREGNGEVVLIVDDEVSIREISKVTLESYGYRVLTAADGTEAVAAYAEKGDDVALVITDMMMPYMDGAATIRAIRKMNPEAKILAVSGLKHDGDGLKDASVRFLHKPYTSETLLRIVGEMLGG